LIGENGVGRMVAVEHPMRHLRLGHMLGDHFVLGAPERKGLGLREEVGHQQVVMRTDIVVGLAEADEVGGDQLRALMDELIVGVLAVVPAVPHTTGPVSVVTDRPYMSTDLPLDSISSCCR
jgi:hypothetical protein